MNNALFVKNAVSQADQPVWLEVVAVQSTRVNTIVRISGTICIYFTFLFFFFSFFLPAFPPHAETSIRGQVIVRSTVVEEDDYSTR